MAGSSAEFTRVVISELDALKARLLSAHSLALHRDADGWDGSNELPLGGLHGDEEEAGQEAVCLGDQRKSSQFGGPQLWCSPPRQPRGPHESRQSIEGIEAPGNVVMWETQARATHTVRLQEHVRLAEIAANPAASKQVSAKGTDESLWGDKIFLALALDSGMGFVIFLNCALIGVSADVAWQGWIFMDLIFAIIFLGELVLQVCLAGWRDYLLGSERRWHYFEIVLVILALLDVTLAFADPTPGEDSSPNPSSLLRFMRIVRITRLFRVYRLDLFCDLAIMVEGTLASSKLLVWSLFLVSLPLYAAALFFRETLGPMYDQGHGAESFKSVTLSFFTLFRCIVMGDCSDDSGRPIFSRVVANYGWTYAFVYGFLSFFMTFGLFNVIIAIYIEQVLSKAKSNDQLLRRQRLCDEEFWGNKMLEMAAIIWQAHPESCESHASETLTPIEILRLASEIHITPEIWAELRHDTSFLEVLNDLDISEEDSQYLFDTLDADISGTIDMEELLEGIEKLRGGARRSDVVSVNLKMSSLMTQLNSQFLSFHEKLSSNDQSLQALLSEQVHMRSRLLS